MSGLAQMATHLKAVHSRNHYVENDHVVGVYLDLVERSLAGIHRIDGVGLLAKALDDEALHARIVFDQKDSHSRIIRERVSQFPFAPGPLAMRR